jgi:hypothetical protein
MKRFIAYVIGTAITAAAASLAASAAPAGTNTTNVARDGGDWSDGGRWLTPYEIPGYSGGYAVSWPLARQTAQAPPVPSAAQQPKQPGQSD